MSGGASSTSSQRDERVFVAAFGMMDSHQDGEAVAAFMRARAILLRHGSSFRRILDRSHEAERLNEELGKQNAQLLRENTALRARDSRPAPSAPSTGTRGPFVMSAIPGSRHWDIGFIGIVAISAAYGLVGIITSLTLIAAILICAAFTNWFSPIRFLVGVLLGLAALSMVAANQSASAGAPTFAVSDAPAPVTPTTAPDTADAARQRQAFVDPSPPPQSLADSPPRRFSVEPRSRHVATARVHCDPYRLQPGSTCPRSTSWGRNFFPNFGRPRSVRFD
jgi:hypothetical protein